VSGGRLKLAGTIVQALVIGIVGGVITLPTLKRPAVAAGPISRT
jgi:hypothetical protein